MSETTEKSELRKRILYDECLVEPIKSNSGVILVMARGGLVETIFTPDECAARIVLSELGLKQPTSVLVGVIILIEGCKGGFLIAGGEQFIAIFSNDEYRSSFLKNDPKSLSEFFEKFFPCNENKFSRNLATIVMIKQISWPAKNEITLKFTNEFSRMDFLLYRKKLKLNQGKRFCEVDLKKDENAADQVLLTNIPFIVDEASVRQALFGKHLKTVTEIIMPNEEHVPVQDVDDYFGLFSKDLKNLKLDQNLKDFYIVEPENKNDFIYRAYIEFFTSTEAEIAIETVKKYFEKKDSKSLNCTKVFPIFRFYYLTPNEIFVKFQWILSKLIYEIRDKRKEFIFYNVKEEFNYVTTKIECESLMSCSEIKFKLDSLLKGVQYPVPNFKQTNAKHHKIIRQITMKNNASSHFNKQTSVLCICAENYEAISRVKCELDANFNEGIPVNKSIDLKDPQYSKGLLKTLVNKFGFDLMGLKSQIGADLDLNIRDHSILFTGSQEAFEELQNILSTAEIFTELIKRKESRRKAKKKSIGKKDGMAECLICGDEIKRVPGKYYATEHCGHVFCLQCIVQSIKADCKRLNFPITCYKEGCHSLLVVKDFQNLLATEDFELLLESSVKFYQRKNSDKFLFCSTLECPIVFKKTAEKEKFVCLHCYGCTCTKCGKVFHDGEMCESN